MRTQATIDSGALERNAAHLKGLLTGGAELCVVVKADGYGHGAVISARAAQAGGATWVAVATAREAAQLRSAGIGGPILVMGALTGEEAAAAVTLAEADVVAWDPAFVAALPRPARVHVKLDTGMGRLGTKDPEVADALADEIAAAEGLELVGAMTHFATADELGDDRFPAQLEWFSGWARALKERHPGVVAHAANSAATYRAPGAHFDMVRCGVALYGLDPFQGDPSARGLEPAMEVSATLGAVRRFEAGESAGYGSRWTANEATWVGTVSIGYGDGWRRGLSGNADVLVAGRRRPLVGTVSMDNITVDLGPEPEAQPGDTVVLIGEQGGERILAEEVARRLETINYEVTCGFSPRVPRVDR